MSRDRLSVTELLEQSEVIWKQIVDAGVAQALFSQRFESGPIVQIPTSLEDYHPEDLISVISTRYPGARTYYDIEQAV